VRRLTYGHATLWTVLAAIFALSYCAVQLDAATLINALQQDTQTGKVVVIVLDDSGSMNKSMAGNEPKMVVAKRALIRVIETLPPNTQLGILLMNGASADKGWLVPLGPLDVVEATRRVSATVADGGTPLGASMKRGLDELLKLRDERPYGEYRLLVVTDGEASDADVLKRNLPLIVSRGVVLDVIGVDMQADHSLAKRSHSYRRANDAQSFEKALKEVFAESTADDNLNSQAGFDLIAALPDEMASEALQALRESGQASLAKSNGGGDAKQTATGPNAGSNVQSGKQNVTQPANNLPEKNNPGSSKFFFVVIVVVVFMVLRGLLNQKKRR
jgi:von Willebrand factor type A domain